MNDCPREWSICRFEPRYDTEPSGNINIDGLTEEGFLTFVQHCQKRTYVRDICAVCGKTVERK